MAAVAPTPEMMRTLGWGDYALLDSGDGKKLERYGRFTVVRPEPQCFWRPKHPELWAKADAVFDPDGDEDEGRWAFSAHRTGSAAAGLGARPSGFHSRFTAFRHLAFFPEQAANWAWLHRRVGELDKPRVLNLFGYTGVASLICATAGAEVTHVDASKKAIGWARENATLSRLDEAPVRWICEDARKYVGREVKRGSRYEGIILDPPKYGRGPGGEVWRLFEDLPELARQCAALLSDSASFLLLNAYAARVSGPALSHLLAEAVGERGGRVDWGELTLVEDGDGPREIGLSFFARWSDR